MTNTTTEDSHNKSDTQTPPPAPDTDTPQQGSEEKYDELLERLKSTEAVPDELAKTIAENWKRALGALALVIVLMFVVDVYKKNKAERDGEASRYFSEVQSAFSSLQEIPAQAEPAEEGKEAEPKVNPQENSLITKLGLIDSSYSGTAYSEMTALYRASRNLNKGNAEAAIANLNAKYPLSGLNSTPTPGAKFEPEVLVDEIASLLYAKALFSQPKTKDQGRAKLIHLAKHTRVVAPDAIMLLMRSAVTDQHKQEAMNLAIDVRAARPELGDLIERDLNELGVVLPEK